MPFAVLLVPFFAIVAAFVLIGLSRTMPAQHGTGGIKGFIDTAIANSLVGQLVGLGKKAAHALVSRYAASHLKMLTAYLHGLAQLWKGIFRAQQAEAQATVKVAHAIEQAIPREAKKAAAPAHYLAKVGNRHALAARAEARATARELNRFRTNVRAQLRHDAHALDVTLPNDIAGLRRRAREVEDAQAKQGGAIADIEHGAAETWDWIRSHPLSSVTALFAGAIVVALARLGYGFLQCRSWRNVGKRLNCGIGSKLLNLLDGGLGDLLGVFLTVEATANFRDLVKLGQEVEHGVAVGIKELLNVVE